MDHIYEILGEINDSKNFVVMYGRILGECDAMRGEKKMRSVVKGAILCLLICLVTATLAGCLGKKNGASGNKDEAAKYTCDVAGVGAVVGKVSSNVGIAIYKIEETNVLGGNPFMREKAMGKFIVVSLVVHNNQKDAVTVDNSCFKLVDKNGREYSYSSDGFMAIAVGNGGDTKGFLTELNPGIVTNFVIPYDVPANLDISQLSLKARGGMTGKDILLPLAVQLEGGGTIAPTTQPQAQAQQQTMAQTSTQSPPSGADMATLGGVYLGEPESSLGRLGQYAKRNVQSDGYVNYVYGDIEVQCANGQVCMISSNSGSVQTDRGIHEQSSLQEVLNAYGGGYKLTTYNGLNLYEYVGPGGSTLRFAVNPASQRVSYISIRNI